MPRNGTKNLIPINTLSKERQQEIRSMGGKASQAKRRERKSLKEQMLLMLETDPTIQDRLIEKLFERAYKTGEKTGAAANRAFEIIRETIGETPIIEKKVDVVVEDLQPLANLLTITEEEKQNG